MRARSQRNSSQRRLVYTVLFTLLVIGLGLLLPRLFSAVSAVAVYPFHATSVWLEESSSAIPTFVRSRAALREEIERLNTELVIAQRVELSNRRLLEENDRLRQLLSISDADRIVAGVIARPTELPYDLLQIDRGSAHGVTPGSPVFIGRDVVIGLVVHTASDYSFVELLTTPGFEATAFISGANITAVMEGMGGGVARVKVPQGIPLRVGDLVLLPSVEAGVFGRIAHVENRPTQPEQYGYISPDLSVSSIYQVGVGQQSQIAQSPEEIDQTLRQLIADSVYIVNATSTLPTEASTSSATTTP